ncbi:MAG: hypothetical protein JW839_19630 [Candidatus Lokiarchaeota archaeon]|nr:hypothetical protein [Candidatus Lokiarchaeota archaeon]
MKGSLQPGHLYWRLARAVLAESRYKAGRNCDQGGVGGSCTSIALACVTAAAIAPVLVVGNDLTAFLAIQAAFLTLVAVSAAGQARKPGILSFLSVMPLPPGAAGRSVGLAIALATALPAAVFPSLAAVVLAVARPGAAYSALAITASVLVAAWPACLSFLLAPAVLRRGPGASRQDAQESSISFRPSSPTWAVGRALLGVMFKDARHAATVLAPAIAAAAVILAGFSFDVSDPVIAFFWLYVLTGFLPFFIASAVSGAGYDLAPGFLALPRYTRRLLGAKQGISGLLFLAILGASTAFVAGRVADPGRFLLLAASLPLVGWFSCSLTLLALESLGHFVHVGRHFVVLVLAFNVFGSMFWNLSMVEPLGAAMTTASTVALGIAGIVLLDVLKRLAYRAVG